MLKISPARIYTNATSGRIVPSATIRVYQIGCSNAVKDFYRDAKKPKPARYLCLIDGDFGYIHGTNQSGPNLHYLNCYTSENLIVSTEPIDEIIEEIQPNTGTTERVALIQRFTDEIFGQFPMLEKLMIAYCVTNSRVPTTATVGASILSLTVSPNSYKLCPIKYKDVLRQYSSQLLSDGERPSIWNEIREVRKQIKNKGVSRSASGKTMILPLVYQWLRSHGYRGSIDSLKVRMAKHCSLDVDIDLIKKTQAICA